MSIGIDAISFATSDYFLDLRTLADVKHQDADKFYVGIGQEKMGIAPLDEDVVTMAATAAQRILEGRDCERISTVLFATETGIDQSKSAGIYVHGLLGLPVRCRVVELKQACYSATAALQMACALVARDPGQEVLVIASDIARYDLDSSGEATQGCGACAMIVSAAPRLVEIAPHSGLYTEDVMDFWRPNYRSNALVDGKYSTKIYLKALKKAWQHYHEVSGVGLEQLDYICYHLPFSRMAEKAQTQLARAAAVSLDADELQRRIEPTLHYNRIIGNSYTASMYIGLASLLDHAGEDLGGRRIGFFSYGSGCVGEFFAGRIVPGYREHLHTAAHRDMLAAREELDYPTYLEFCKAALPEDGGEHLLPERNRGPFRLAGISQHKRIYQARA